MKTVKFVKFAKVITGETCVADGCGTYPSMSYKIHVYNMYTWGESEEGKCYHFLKPYKKIPKNWEVPEKNIDKRVWGQTHRMDVNYLLCHKDGTTKKI